jgi:hypothetical protein
MSRRRLIIFAITITVFYSLIVVINLVTTNGDFSSFIKADARYTDAPITILPTNGYDGQFFYRLAIEPFSFDPVAAGVTFDKPYYRQQRILYPIIAHFFALGQTKFVPAALVLVNLFGIFILAYLSAVYMQEIGLSYRWGAVIALYPGFAISLGRDLSEIIAVVFVIAGLLTMKRKQRFLSIVLFSLAVLTRETTILIPLAIAIFSQYRLYFIPVVIGIAWQIFLQIAWGAFPAVGAIQILPLSGVLYFLVDSATDAGRWFELIALLAFLILVIKSYRISPAETYIKTAWLMYGGLATSLSFRVWKYDTGMLRALSEFYVCGALIILYQMAAIYPSLMTWWSRFPIVSPKSH